MKRKFRIAVFVSAGKRKWLFRAYLQRPNPSLSGCNIVEVEAANVIEAKKKAIAQVKAQWGEDLKSKIVPSGVNVAFSSRATT